jgi:hypothetical protein
MSGLGRLTPDFSRETYGRGYIQFTKLGLQRLHVITFTVIMLCSV